MTFGLYTWKFHDRTQICICAPHVFMCLLLHKTQGNMIVASRGARRRPLCRVGAPFQGTHFWYAEMGAARTWGGGPWCLLSDQKLWAVASEHQVPPSTRKYTAWECGLVHSVWTDQLQAVTSRYFPVLCRWGLEKRVIVPVERFSESEQSVKPSGHLPSAA